jgi:hypothetical protein
MVIEERLLQGKASTFPTRAGVRSGTGEPRGSRVEGEIAPYGLQMTGTLTEALTVSQVHRPPPPPHPGCLEQVVCFQCAGGRVLP